MQTHHEYAKVTNSPSGPNFIVNNYSRPRPRHNNLYEPSSMPDQQFLQERVRLQHQFLVATASVALQTALTPAEGQEKEAFRLELEHVAQLAVTQYSKSNLTSVDPTKVKLKCYGSLASGFAVEGSDLDLLLMFPNCEQPLGSFETDCQRLLERAFLDAGYGARLLTKTRVPILRVCQKPTSELLENLRMNRTRWEVEEAEEQALNDKQTEMPDLNVDRLPQATDEQLLAASKAFAELEFSPTNIPLPPSPVRDHASLEYKGDVGIHCDINFSNYVAIHNTTLLRCYCKCDPRVREMGLFVKAWAKVRKINTPYYGTLSSYGYILMVLHYLLNVAKPPVIPNLQHMARDADAWAGKTEIELFEGFDIRFYSNEQKIQLDAKAGQITENKQSLGALLHGFFWYFSDRQGFRWIDEVISIRTVGGILTKHSKGWTEGKWAGENNQIRLRYLFAIEDPFEIEHNIARTVGHTGVVAIRDEFRRAWEIIGKVRLTHAREWLWRKGDGTTGEDLLAKAEDRGDLLKKDQEYHRKKQQDMRAAFVAKKAKGEAAKVDEMGGAGQEAGSERLAESGMSTASMSNPAHTNEGVLSIDRSNSKLMRSSKPQLTPTPTKGRRRTVRTGSDSSGGDVNRKSPNSSVEDAETVSKSTAEITSLQECNAGMKSSKESEDSASQAADGYCPYIDPSLLNTSMPLRLEDVSVRPGANDDGKPLAWNTNSQAGRWLHWRDQKIRRGESDPERYSVGLFNSLHHLFPYDASRPVSRLSGTAQKRNEWLRKKRMAYYTQEATKPGSAIGSGSNDTGDGQHATNILGRVVLETLRKDSAISGIIAPGLDSAVSPRSEPQEPSVKIKRKNASRKQPVRPGSEERTVSADRTSRVPKPELTTGPIRDGIDASLRPRDEDPNIMPIPPRVGFTFDPRQLRDIAIIRQGGNGCARGGEEWNVEIEGEWGGGGVMGAMKTSSGLITTPMEVGGGHGSADDWEYGRGDEEGLLGELPDFGGIED